VRNRGLCKRFCIGSNGASSKLMFNVGESLRNTKCDNRMGNGRGKAMGGM